MLKYFVSFLIILFITLFLLEISAVVFFNSLTGQDFNKVKMQDEYQLQINAIDEKLNSKKTLETVFMLHPYSGYVHTPTPGVNSYGMIAPSVSVPHKKTDNEFVIAVIGGSVATKFAVDNNNHGYLQKALRTLKPSLKNKKITIIPFAAGGYKQPQHLFSFQYALLAGFEFDLVINIDGFNDLVMAVRNFEEDINPIFPSGYHTAMLGKLARGIDFNLAKSLTRIYNIHQSELNFLKLMKHTPFKQSRFINIIAQLRLKYNKNTVDKLHYNIVEKAQKEMPIEFKGPTFNKKLDKYEMAVKIWKNASLQVWAICQLYKIEYLHILQPNQYVKDSKILSVNEKEVAYRDTPWAKIVIKAYHLLIQQEKSLNRVHNNGKYLLFKDMTMIFKDNTEDLYNDDCCHFNARGNEIFSQKIAQLIISKKLYPTIFDQQSIN
jgi:hypothetical protein